MEAVGYLIGAALVAAMIWSAVAPFVQRRYPRDNRRR
jgi:hypothetical protein